MTDDTKQVATTDKAEKSVSLIQKFAGKYGLDPAIMMTTLKSTAFKQKGRNAVEITNEQMAALIVVADQYNLNPWTKEIYAYPDQGGIVPVVGVDGWARIINEHKAFDGLEFVYSEDIVKNGEHKDCPSWCEVIIHRSDRAHTVTVREYFDEVYRPPFVKNGNTIKGPWQTHTKRMLRHKALIQAARIGFGFVGIHDADEAERIIEAEYEVVDAPEVKGDTTTKRIKSVLGVGEAAEEPPADVDKATGEVISKDTETGDGNNAQ